MSMGFLEWTGTYFVLPHEQRKRGVTTYCFNFLLLLLKQHRSYIKDELQRLLQANEVSSALLRTNLHAFLFFLSLIPFAWNPLLLSPPPPRVSILIPIIEFSSFLEQHKNILSASEKFLVCYVRFFPVFLVLLIFIELCFPLQFR